MAGKACCGAAYQCAPAGETCDLRPLWRQLLMTKTLVLRCHYGLELRTKPVAAFQWQAGVVLLVRFSE